MSKEEFIKGVCPTTEVVVNELGGAQSKTFYRTDLVDPRAFLRMCEVLQEGHDKYTKYGFENWRNIPTTEHLNHLIVHVYAYLAGDDTDEHLSHALCRAMFALGVDEQSEQYIEDRGEVFN